MLSEILVKKLISSMYHKDSGLVFISERGHKYTKRSIGQIVRNASEKRQNSIKK